MFQILHTRKVDMSKAKLVLVSTALLAIVGCGTVIQMGQGVRQVDGGGGGVQLI